MAVKLKLKATVVRSLGDSAFSDTVSSESYQQTIAGDRPVERADDEPAMLPDIGDVVGGQYRLVSRLGEGMFGSVYVAERTDVNEHRVALKLINRAVYGDRDNKRELVMLAAATHPHIVELKDHGTTSDYIWLTMALYEGETLAARLKRGTLDLEEAHRIFVPIAQGVAALHARGLRHQDIKPENIYLADFAGHLHPVLLDLGVAVEADSDFVAGTALFGAPEQLAALGGIGEPGRLSERMDTYCLASTLLYALVGEEYFPGGRAKTPFDIVKAFSEREESPLDGGALPELTDEPRRLLGEAFARWLTKDPEERPDIGEVAEELDVLLEKRRAEEREERNRILRQKTTLKRVQLALVAIAVAVGGGGLYLLSKRQTLELAAELERARQERTDSFDQLDTCQAAHDVSKSREQACQSTRQQDGAEFAKTLAVMEGKIGDVDGKLTSANHALKTCEDESEQAALVCAEEQDALRGEVDEAKTTLEETKAQLTKELEAAKEEAKTALAAAEAADGRVTGCEKELASCRAEPSDIYTPPPSPAPKAPPAKAPPPPPPPGDPYE